MKPLRSLFRATDELLAGTLEPQRYAQLYQQYVVTDTAKWRLIKFALRLNNDVVPTTTALLAFFGEIKNVNHGPALHDRVSMRELSLETIRMINECCRCEVLIQGIAVCLKPVDYLTLNNYLGTHEYNEYHLGARRKSPADWLLRASVTMPWLLDTTITEYTHDGLARPIWYTDQPEIREFYTKGNGKYYVFAFRRNFSWAQTLFMWRCTGRLGFAVWDREFVTAYPEVLMEELQGADREGAQIILWRLADPAIIGEDLLLKGTYPLLRQLRRQEMARRLAAMLISSGEDGELKLGSSPSEWTRFFAIGHMLPMELQVVLCSRVCGVPDDHRPNDRTFRWLFGIPQNYDISLQQKIM